jgi:ubiquinone/menaquinone biosynthesis C-methylase UbiE
MPQKTEQQNPEAPPTRGRTIRLFANLYDASSWLMSFGQGWKVDREIVEAAAVQPGERVLDIGCGTGALTFPAADSAGAANVAGIDASPEMIEVARRKAGKRGVDLQFRLAPAEDLPFADGEFDVVLSGFMLHHLPEDVMRQAFAEALRVLKPGGRFLAADMVARSLMGRVIRLTGHAHPVEGVDRMKEMLKEAGFQSVEEIPQKKAHFIFIRSRK